MSSVNINPIKVTPGPLPGTEPGAGLLSLGLWQKHPRKSLWILVALLFFGAVASEVIKDSAVQPTVGIAGVVFNVQVADDEVEQVRGLSNTSSLADNEGMLFVFGTEDYWPIWMKGMSYPIDILWIDSYMQVVHIEQNVSPSTYPSIFESDVPALYVLELPAGSVEKHSFERYQIANFKL